MKLQFKKRVLPLMEKDYQREDIYILRWLRGKLTIMHAYLTNLKIGF
jgi:hypothetical protein